MAGLPWYKCNPVDLLDGIACLSSDETRAYIILINTMYAHGKPIKDSAPHVCGMTDLDPRVWKRVRASLIEKGKLVLNAEGFLTNARVELELAKQETTRGKRSGAGKKSGEVRAAKASKNDACLVASQGAEDGRYDDANPSLSARCDNTTDALTVSNGVAPDTSAMSPNKTGATHVRTPDEQNRTDRDREEDRALCSTESSILPDRVQTRTASPGEPATGAGPLFGEGGESPGTATRGGGRSRASTAKSEPGGDAPKPGDDPKPDAKPDAAGRRPGEGTAAVEAYNEAAGRAGWVKAIGAPNKARQAAIRQRLRECGGLDGWKKQLAIAERQPHLGGANAREWRMNLDWFVNATNWSKVAEGYYLPKGAANVRKSALTPNDQIDPTLAKWRLAINRLRDTGEWPRIIEDYQRTPASCPSTLRDELIAVLTERGMAPASTTGRSA